MTPNPYHLAAAISDFRLARRRAVLQELLARITRRQINLLAYDDVRVGLHGRESGLPELREIPLDSIIGSVGRPSDFTRSFLPLRESDLQRWAGVQAAVTSLEGLPPIDVYQIDEAYFVLDGNHRVSVARQLGATQIEAYVTKVRTRVPLAKDDTPDDIILKAQYTQFLEETHLDEHRPEQNLTTTIPGQYRVIREHIEVHRYFIGIDEQRDIANEEAVLHWYDHVYMPVVGILRELGVLWHFPERTETDLYVLLASHRATLEARLGWQVSTEAAIADLTTTKSERPRSVAARIAEGVVSAFIPAELESGPPTGQWRRELVAARETNQLFHTILVALTGNPSGWTTLDRAIDIAQREEARLLGLHVLTEESDQTVADEIQGEFERRCREADIQSDFAFEHGNISEALVARARWTDLVMLPLNHPPEASARGRLGSGLRRVIRRSGRPVLALPPGAAAPAHGLLAYDGSPKADEALFMAAYFAGQWQLRLTVLYVSKAAHADQHPIKSANEYLAAHGVDATYVQEKGAVEDVILETAQMHNCDLIMMGSYRTVPVLEVVLGSVVDSILRQTQLPIMICR